MKAMRGSAIIAVIALLVPVAGHAAPAESFGGFGGYRAGWVRYEPRPHNAGEDLSIELFVDGFGHSSAQSTAYVKVNGVDATLPAVAPSFWLRTDRAFTVANPPGAYYGQPSFLIELDAGSLFFGPTSWPANTWGKVDGASYLWRASGGSCGLGAWMTYADATSCLAGGRVTGIQIMLQAPTDVPYTMHVDDIAFGSTTISYPTSCLSDTTGEHENGPISKKIHNKVEPIAANASPVDHFVHSANCKLVVYELHE